MVGEVSSTICFRFNNLLFIFFLVTNKTQSEKMTQWKKIQNTNTSTKQLKPVTHPPLEHLDLFVQPRESGLAHPFPSLASSPSPLPLLFPSPTPSLCSTSSMGSLFLPPANHA